MPVVIRCAYGASELDARPERLAKTPPVATEVRELIDFNHLMGYLDNVVDALQPYGNTRERKSEHHTVLLADDMAIDSVWEKLRRLEKRVKRTGTAKLKLVTSD